MQIIGVQVPGGTPVFVCDLPHGADPHRLAWEHGFSIVRPLSTAGVFPGLTLTVQVRHHDRHVERHAPAHVRSVLPDEVFADPVPRQRLAAYAIVLSGRGLLATQFSEQTAVPGLWGLPGGGIDAGESPSQAVVREIMEETGQRLVIRQLLDLQTDHWIGRSPAGVVEDFHAVRIIYSGHTPDPTDPVVNDVGGTTSVATWLPVADWGSLNWSQSARILLERHLPSLTRH